MDSSNDVIEKLLQTTGLSYDDLLQKLQQYKVVQEKKTVENSSSVSKTEEGKCSDKENFTTSNRISEKPEEKDSLGSEQDPQLNPNSSQKNIDVSTGTDNKTLSKKSEPLLVRQNEETNGDEEKTESSVNKTRIEEEKTEDNEDRERVVDNEDKEKIESNEDKEVAKCKEDRIEDEVNKIAESNQDKERTEKQTAESSEDKERTKNNEEKEKREDNQDQEKEEHNEDEIKVDSTQDKGRKGNNGKEKSESNPFLQICSGIDDHNYSNTRSNFDSDQDISISSNDDLSRSEDDLRNTIRKQLSSLRNMKKSSSYLPDIQKKRSVFLHNLKKKRKSCDVNPVRLSIDSDQNEEDKDGDELKKDEDNDENRNKVVEPSDDFLISLTDETNFVILNVTGGVDRFSEENEESKSGEDKLCDMKNVINSDSGHSSSDPIFLQDSRDSDKSPPKEADASSTNCDSTFVITENDSISASPVNEERPRTLTVRKNMSENFKQDPGINKSIKNSEKSPFISDSLEDFLNESSQLKISYSIPKLRAEEGITESTKKSPFDNNLVKRTTKFETSDQQDNPHKEKPKLIKAKTLAEMRRHIEKLKSHDQNISSTTSFKGSTFEKEEIDSPSSSLLQVNTEEEFKISTNPISPKKISPHRNSFILFNRRKLWVPTHFRNRCVSIIDCKRGTKERKGDLRRNTDTPSSKNLQGTSRKLSLLSSLNQCDKSSKVKYKPGPLSKKVALQNMESREKWITEIKTLPKVYLEVTPEVNKPIQPDLVHLLPIFNDSVISEERASFALSTLKSKAESKQTTSFKFHIPYKNNQEKIIVRKVAHLETPNVDSVKNINKDPTTEIASVLNDIISYIEIKEIEHTLVKEDDSVIEKPEEKINEANVKKKTRKVRRRKLDLELRRLNCKVVDVATDIVEDKECTKPYCKMGCVCKSLLCESIFSNHCQLVECMFGCKCPPAPANEIMTINNSLPAHTVNHLEDKAKKNLAKVEREFTQTLIHTDNDVIFVGTGGRKRMRASKAPKKYTDFVSDDIDEILENDQPPPQEKEIIIKECSVNITNLNLSDIIPYCLCHEAYNCFCKGKMLVMPAAQEMDTDNQIPKIRIVKTKEDQSKPWYHSCARIRRVFPEYKKRNKHPLYNKRLHAKNIYNSSESDPVSREPTFLNPISEINVETGEESKDHQSLLIKKPNKRKQSFNLREETTYKNITTATTTGNTSDTEKEYALQRRKKKLKLSNNSTDNNDFAPKKYISNSPTDNDLSAKKYIPIFDGEIKVPLKDNPDMLKIIGEENASLEYLRILPWTKLIESFRSKKMCIWSREKRSSVLLCNAAGYFPPKFFMDIRRVQEKSDIINWILTDSLPPERPRELMHLILTPRKNHFLMAGFCLKKVDIESTNICSLPKRDVPDSKALHFISSLRPGLQIIPESLENRWPGTEKDPLKPSLEAQPKKRREPIQLIKLPRTTDMSVKSLKEIAGTCYIENTKQSTLKPIRPISISKLAESTAISKSLQSVLNSGILPITVSRIRIKPIKHVSSSETSPSKTDVTPVQFISVSKKVEGGPHNRIKQLEARSDVTIIKSNSSPKRDSNVDLLSPDSEAERKSKKITSPSTSQCRLVPIGTTIETIVNTQQSVKSDNSRLNSPEQCTYGDKMQIPRGLEEPLKKTHTEDNDITSSKSPLHNKKSLASPKIKVISDTKLKETGQTLQEKSVELANSQKSQTEFKLKQYTKIKKPTKSASSSLQQSEELELNVELTSSQKLSGPKTYSSLLKTKNVERDQSPIKSPVHSVNDDLNIESSELNKSKRKQSPSASAKKQDPEDITRMETVGGNTATESLTKEGENVKESSFCPQSRTNIQQKKTTNTKQSVSESKQTNKTSSLVPSRSVKCTHKDMYNKSKTLILVNKEFPRRRLYYTDRKSEVNKILYIPLPAIAKRFRWRMIFLNSDFSFLAFVKSNYSIKYTDLMDVVKMSNNVKSTIILRNKEFCNHYKHPYFGIFCVPQYQDRLFVGPYLQTEEHNTETLRYMRGKLIDTQIFNRMLGKSINDKFPLWLYESPVKPRLPMGLVIDITQDDDETSGNGADDDIYIIDDNDAGGTTATDFFDECLLCPPFVEKLTDEELQNKKVNRYIITNIPHLGYFSACQRENKAIEVYWPNDTSGFRFPNVTFAKNALILYLSKIFYPVPQEFKINVIILTQLDLQSNKPVDLKYFSHSKSYVCGEFGIYEKDNIPQDLLEHYKIDSIESLESSEEHLEETTNKMIRLFGLFLMSNEELRKRQKPEEIMQWAKSEIYILKKLSDNYDSEKVDLRNIIRANESKINTNKSQSPKQSTTNKSIDETKVTTTIEIDDSDDEVNETETPKEHETPVFKKICHSGKICSGGSNLIYPSNDRRSVLKSKIMVKSDRSLLKISDLEMKRFQISPTKESKLSASSVKIPLNTYGKTSKSENIVLNNADSNLERSKSTE